MSKITPLQYWEYRAYNSDFEIVENQAKAGDFKHLVLTLRQNGLQVIEANLVSNNQCVANNRLNKMKRRLHYQVDEELDTKKPRLSIRKRLWSVICLFRRR